MRKVEITMQPKFDLGNVGITRRAAQAMASFDNSAKKFAELLVRHASGDWGEIAESDKRMNDRALTDGNMILSQYRIGDELMLWVISDPADDAGQRVTSVLLPDER